PVHLNKWPSTSRRIQIGIWRWETDTPSTAKGEKRNTLSLAIFRQSAFSTVEPSGCSSLHFFEPGSSGARQDSTLKIEPAGTESCSCRSPHLVQRLATSTPILRSEEHT